MTKRRIEKCTGTRLHNIWRSMKQRCSDKNHHDFKWYGVCGVEVCEAWSKDYWVFHAWAMTHGYAPDLTIDRLRGGNYAHGDCRWVDRTTQVSNMRGNVYLVARGEE